MDTGFPVPDQAGPSIRPLPARLDPGDRGAAAGGEVEDVDRGGPVGEAEAERDALAVERGLQHLGAGGQGEAGLGERLCRRASGWRS